MRLQLKTCSGVYRRHLADVLVGSMPMVSRCCKRTTPFQQLLEGRELTRRKLTQTRGHKGIGEYVRLLPDS